MSRISRSFKTIFSKNRASETFTLPIPRRVGLEPASRYEPGGYHPVRAGEVYNERYEVLQQLGWGVHSTVWLVRDNRTKDLKALKVLVGHLTGNEFGHDELGLLKIARDANHVAPGYGHMCHLRDDFVLEGPHGTHTCLVLDAMGVNVLDIFRSIGGPMPTFLLKRITKHTLHALQFLHEDCGIVHADIKGDNILMTGTPFPMTQTEHAVDMKDLMSSWFKLTDLGVAVRTCDPANLSLLIQPEALRAPEVIVRAEWSPKIDIWNLGCLVFEFARGRKLFDPRLNNAENGLKPIQEHLIQITGLCGNFPLSLLRTQSAEKHFDSDGQLRTRDEKRRFMSFEERLIEGGFPLSDIPGLCDFLKQALVINPAERSSAQQLLNHPWLRDVK